MAVSTRGGEPRVVVSNAYADDNRGGAALTAAAIDMARRAVPGCQVTLVSVATHEDIDEAFRHTRALYPDVEILQPPFSARGRRLAAARAILRSLVALAVPAVHRRSVPAVARIAEAALVIGKGGQVFRDFPLRGLGGLWLTSFPLVLAARLGRPAVAFGVSIGPYTRGHPAAGRLAGLILRRVSLVLARGEYSARLARELGVRPEHILDVPDTVFSLAPPSDEEVEEITQRLGLPRRRYLALTVTDGMARSDRAPIVFPMLADILGRALEDQLVDEVAVVVQTDGKTSDAAASAALVEYLSDRRVRLIREDLGHRQLMALYGGAAATIGGRIHSAVFSVVAGTPAFPLEGGGHKAREIFGRFGQESRALRLLDETSTDMYARIRAVLLDGDRSEMARAARELRQQFDSVAGVLAELAARAGEGSRYASPTRSQV